MTKSEDRSSRLTPEQSRQARYTQRLAALILIIALNGIVLPFVFGQWQFNLQTLGAVLAETGLFLAMLVAIYQLRAGRLARAGWIMIGGLLIAPLAISLVIAGTNLAVGLIIIVVIAVISDLTLTPAAQGRAIGLAVSAAIVSAVLDVVDVPNRIIVPVINNLLPIIAVIFLGLLSIAIIRRFSNYALRTKLIVVSLTVSLVPLALVGVLFALGAQQNAITAANQALQGAARETGDSLDTFIQTNLNDVRVASQIPEFVDLLKSPDRETAAYAASEGRAAGILRSLRRRDPIFLRSYALLDKDGNNLLDTSRADIGLSESTRNYFVGPVASNLPYVSPVTTEANADRPSIYFSAPIRDSSGELRGVLRARYDALVLQEQVFRNNGLGGSASGAMLLDENNIKLADGLQPDNVFKIVGQPTPEEISALKIQQRLPDLTAADIVINAPEFERGLANAAQQPLFEMSLAANQERAQAAVSALTAQPWKVVFSRTQNEFLGPLNQQTRTILLGGLFIVMVVAGVAVVAAQAIARPVVLLTETAQKVRQGDLNAQAQVTSRDEIGVLALTFNDMTSQLRGLVASLEDRVKQRTEQLRASAEVGRAATSILEPDRLANQIAGLITARFDFYYAAVFTLDPEGKRAVLRAATGEAGHILMERHHELPVTAESMVGTAIITRRARIALDVQQGAERFANPLLPNTRSEIALPLRVGDRVLGALDVQSEQVGAFDDASAEVLQAMADQIAVALFNAETFTRSEKQAQALIRLNQLSHELAQATTREAVALTTVQTIMNLIGPERVALIEATASPNLLSMRELQTDPVHPFRAAQSLSVTGSLTGECLRRGEIIYVADLSTLVDKYEDVALVYPLGVRSSVALPLRVGERVIGTLNVASNRVNAYTAEQISQLEQVAAQVALTLDGLNLTKQTQQALAELDAANRRLVGEAWSNYMRAGGLVSAEWRNGEWNATRQHTRSAGAASSQALAAAHAINLPIKVRGETIGEFRVVSAKAQADWNADDFAFAQSLIDQVGQVIETARLLEETERSAKREKAVADAADKIHRSTNIETVLHSAITELNRITGRSGISIQLGFGQTDQADGNGKNTGPEGDR